jgi:hypothetical protein
VLTSRLAGRWAGTRARMMRETAPLSHAARFVPSRFFFHGQAPLARTVLLLVPPAGIISRLWHLSPPPRLRPHHHTRARREAGGRPTASRAKAMPPGPIHGRPSGVNTPSKLLARIRPFLQMRQCLPHASPRSKCRAERERERENEWTLLRERWREIERMNEHC